MVRFFMQALGVRPMTEKILDIQLRGGPPWGFRLKGGKGSEAPLHISLLNPKGRQQGLKEGDLVLAVNGQSTAEMTHAEAQRAVKDASHSVELHIQRRIPSENGGMNGESSLNDVPLNQNSSHDEDAHHNHSWSTDSTSTGSTIIHVSPHSSEELSSGPELIWSPSTIRKKTNLTLNCHLPDRTESSEETFVREIRESLPPSFTTSAEISKEEDESSPVWQPFGAPYDGPQFRPVKLEVATTTRKTTAVSQSEQPKEIETDTTEVKVSKPVTDRVISPTMVEKTNPDSTSPSSTTVTGTNFVKSGWGSHLPHSQSPTITLLQKAREGQLPKGAIYIDEKPDSSPLPKNAVLIDQKVTVEGDKVHTDSYYAVPTLSTTTESSTHTIKAPKYEGIGPTEYGIPVGLRTTIKDEYASDWYKTMYKSLHKHKFPNDPSHTMVHYGGYMSEPEYDRKDTYLTKYSTADYRRMPEKCISRSPEPPRPSSTDIKKVAFEPFVVKHEPEKYKVEPRSIADYEPGKSSLAEKEFQKFWSDFWDSMDDLHEHLGDLSLRPHHKAGLSRRWPNVLLSDGYESDSTLIRKTGRTLQVDPETQKSWYKEIQKGGEIPLIGLRKTVPEKPSASPHHYQESEVNIHYRSPIRNLEKEYIEEDELRRRQEEAMRKFYEEEKRKKHLQELAEIEMRRHSDFFTPSQKSPIPLNRYDNPFETSYTNKLAPPGHRGPPPQTMARTLYPFIAQTPRELSLNKGDIVYITKQIDKNWYEGEHHGLIGIFPLTYVEIIPSEKANLQPRKATEGEAVVKYNFRALTPVELSLFKGEKVILTRRMDQNWYEGRLGMKKGIFPISYVHVLQEPGEYSTYGSRAISPKPPASPVYSPIVNGSPPKVEGPTFNTGLRPLQDKPPLNLDKLDTKSSLTQSLHIDTYNEPIPYRALYSYKPQNDDELELKEGDTVYVMEKCDDGWYVGTSLRTGLFGTFPGNYVERI